MVKSTKILLNIAKEELYSIRMCHECHSRANEGNANWFVSTCQQPHLLVWAKQKGFPYWPAKLMLVNNDQNTVDVRYFDSGHLRAVLTLKDCFMYSKQSPKLNFGEHKKSIIRAQQVGYWNIVGKWLKIDLIVFFKTNSNCTLWYLFQKHDFHPLLGSRTLHSEHYNGIWVVQLCSIEYFAAWRNAWASFVWYDSKCMEKAGKICCTITNTEASVSICKSASTISSSAIHYSINRLGSNDHCQPCHDATHVNNLWYEPIKW